MGLDFKLGDRVQTILPGFRDSGKFGTVAEIKNYSPITGDYYIYSVQFDDYPQKFGFLADELALASVLTKANPRRFILQRNEDASGVSGEGEVAEGVMFADGTVAMRWLTPTPSTAIYNSMDDLIQIHGHENRTLAKFIDKS